jgi:hypothetical protein
MKTLAKRFLILGIIFSMTLGLSITLIAGTTDLIVTDDTYVRFGGNIDKNYDKNASKMLFAKMSHGEWGEPTSPGIEWSRRIYMQFDASAIIGKVTNATLKIYVVEIGTQGDGDLGYDHGALVNLFAVNDDNWTEATLTGANAATPDTANHLEQPETCEVPKTAAGSYYEITSQAITDFVSDEIDGDGKISISLYVEDNNHIKLEDHEHTNPVILSVTTEDVDVCKDGITVCQDTYVRFGGNIAKNYDENGSKMLFAKMSHGEWGEPTSPGIEWSRRIYMKFKLGGLTSAVTKAGLKLFVEEIGTQGDGDLGYVHGALVNLFAVDDDNWTETTLTGENAATPDTANHLEQPETHEVAKDKAGSYVEITSQAITDYVNQEIAGDGVLSISLYVEDNNHIKICDRENANPPQLVVECATGVSDDNSQSILPTQLELLNNYPNPFNPTTKISYLIHRAGLVTLNIYNVRGQLVRTLQDGFVNAGQHEIVWNGLNNLGQEVPAGIYMYTLSMGSKMTTNKMILVK